MTEIVMLDTPANIVLNPATEYVKKFTQEVPREKVLKIEKQILSVSSVAEILYLKFHIKDLKFGLYQILWCICF